MGPGEREVGVERHRVVEIAASLRAPAAFVQRGQALEIGFIGFGHRGRGFRVRFFSSAVTVEFKAPATLTAISDCTANRSSILRS